MQSDMIYLENIKKVAMCQEITTREYSFVVVLLYPLTPLSFVKTKP